MVRLTVRDVDKPVSQSVRGETIIWNLLPRRKFLPSRLIIIVVFVLEDSRNYSTLSLEVSQPRIVTASEILSLCHLHHMTSPVLSMLQ